MSKPKFTIFTPCYNSSPFIKRVFKSLNHQTFKDFEWYVINDASTDNTSELITDYIKTVDFPVVFEDLEENQGLHKNINQAIKNANGEYLVLYGHDDEITSDALQVFNDVLSKYNDPAIGSVYALAKDQNGKLVGKKYPKDEMISTYWEQFYDNDNEAEKFQCFNTNYLREIYPLPTGEFNEQTGGWLWGKFGMRYKSIFVNRILRTYYTNVDTQITANTKRDTKSRMIFNYHVVWVNEFQYHVKNKKRKYRGIAACVSHGLLAGLSLSQILSFIEKRRNKLICLFMYPIALAYNSKHK